MDDFKPSETHENTGAYNPESEYQDIETVPAATQPPVEEPAPQTAPKPQPPQQTAPEDEAIPYYTPSQFAPISVDEQQAASPLQQEAQKPVPESVNPAESSVPQAQPVRPNAPYHQPTAGAYPYQQPQAGFPQQQSPYYGAPVNRQPAPPQGYPQQPYPQHTPTPTAPYTYPVNQQPRPYTPPQPYTQQPYAQQPYAQQPYAQPQQPRPQVNMNENPYASRKASSAEYPAPPAAEKPKTSAGTKAFIIILSILLAAMTAAFVIYIIVSSAQKSQQDSKQPDNGNNIIIGDDNGNNGLSPFGNNQIKATEFDAEIELIADNGETQQRESDNPASVGEPDEKAKEISLLPLPSDKGDAKYTTQSAFETVSPGVVYIATYQDKITEDNPTLVGQGTGTVISADGYIITNAHVLSNSRQYLVEVSLSSEERYQAKIVGFDTWTDLAVLKIDAKNLTPVTFGDSGLIEIGQDVIAIGNAGGTFKNSLTKGIISAVDRELAINKNVRYIQSDAAINPGNSGGPLCNIYGQVIGITSAKISSNVYESMSFSIPSETVREIASDLMRYGYVKGRVRMGFSGYELTNEDIYYYDIPSGVVVSEIANDSSLKNTDIKENDIITAVDGISISSFQDIYDILSDHKPGDKVTLSIYREE